MWVTKCHILETILCGSSQGCHIYSTFVKLESRVHPSTTATLHSCPVEVTQPCLTLDTLKLALHQALLHCNVQSRCINYYTGISSTHTARIEVCQLYKLYLQLVIEHTTQQIVGLWLDRTKCYTMSKKSSQLLYSRLAIHDIGYLCNKHSPLERVPGVIHCMGWTKMEVHSGWVSSSFPDPCAPLFLHLKEVTPAPGIWVITFSSDATTCRHFLQRYTAEGWLVSNRLSPETRELFFSVVVCPAGSAA